jgi:hypothetical protein
MILVLLISQQSVVRDATTEPATRLENAIATRTGPGHVVTCVQLDTQAVTATQA